MKLIVYDLGLLVLFVLFVGIFLYRKRKNLQKQGLLFLYRTSWGIKLINKVGNKYKKTLKFLSYVSISVGYLLMIGILYMVGKIIYLYAAYPHIVKAIKVPPIMPLVPYLPQVFKLDFLPPFYFTYWIIILAIIAITHEFAHGIFAALNKVRIKKTGFGFFPFFLPIFLAAFVELDEEKMKKKKKFPQMAILSAGTFANILTAILFFIIMVLFFSLAFTPAGIVFDDYAYTVVGIAGISMVNNVSIENATYDKMVELMNEEGLNKIQTENGSYVATKEFLERQQNVYNYTFLYYDAPAINAGIEGAITEINGVEIKNLDLFQEELEKYSSGEKVTLKTIVGEEINEYELVLGEHPEEEGSAYLGVGFIDQGKSGVMGKIVNFISSFKTSGIYYESKFEAAWFIYNLFWWLVLISLTVALINMLPVGIFDGGRFFYLTILALTKSEKKAEKTFKFITRFFLFLLLLLMVLWVISFW
jgi:membrane-associated protease RseP (regulator of RpoE activity)